jgi:hypothetical protein
MLKPSSERVAAGTVELESLLQRLVIEIFLLAVPLSLRESLAKFHSSQMTTKLTDARLRLRQSAVLA